MLELVKQKGMYPYEYMDSFKKFFHNKLPDRCEYISEKDYLHAIDVWIMFKIDTMGNLHATDIWIMFKTNKLGDHHDLYYDRYFIIS